MLKLLQQLCEANGISGREAAVRELIIACLPDGCDYTVDPLGNLLVHQQGRQRPAKRLMLSAHMDEVGMIVTSVEADGSLRFASVGGVDPRVLVGRQVAVGEIPGVVGSKPIHLKDSADRDQATPEKELTIDIGASSREQALKLVSPGDSVCFRSEFVRLGDHQIKAKAIDDRFGCALLLKLLSEPQEYDLTCAFVVQEEVGLRGAKAAAFSLNPEIALVLEATTAADLPGVADEQQVCRLGGGPVVPFMDRATVYDKELFDLAFALAEERNIPCQTKTQIAGGNDAGAISQSRGGVRTLSVSLPCRYIHSAACVADERDMQAALALVRALIPAVSR